jgi:hypothetical protein
MAIKRCTPDRGNLLRNLTNDVKVAVEACTPESDDLLLKVVNDMNVAIEASGPESDDLLKSLVNNINTAIGTSTSERDNLLRKVANDIERVIRAGTRAKQKENPPMKQEMKSLAVDERYCDVTGKTMDLGLAGTFSLHRVFSCHLTTSNPQVAWAV